FDNWRWAGRGWHCRRWQGIGWLDQSWGRRILRACTHRIGKLNRADVKCRPAWFGVKIVGNSGIDAGADRWRRGGKYVAFGCVTGCALKLRVSNFIARSSEGSGRADLPQIVLECQSNRTVNHCKPVLFLPDNIIGDQ